MAWIVQDLADITQFLISRLTDAINASPLHVNSPFPFEVSSTLADSNATNTICAVPLYILPDLAVPNSPPRRPGDPVQVPNFSLSLVYLLTSCGGTDWRIEQSLMGIVLAYIQANPVLAGPSGDLRVIQTSVSISDISDIWQALAAPMRLSALLQVNGVSLIDD